ncbi:MAG TPA: hypothetical protein VMB35_01150 [Methanomicrobiales archaeon]|nr:hypothetical protein [Methanomicrobiales archaeon]
MGRHMGEEGGVICMNARMLDITTGIASLVVFIIVLIALPGLPVPGGKGVAYVLAIAVYIALMSGAGILIREQIA